MHMILISKGQRAHGRCHSWKICELELTFNLSDYVLTITRSYHSIAITIIIIVETAEKAFIRITLACFDTVDSATGKGIRSVNNRALVFLSGLVAVI